MEQSSSIYIAKPQMTDEQYFAVVDSAFADSCSPSIGMSGGEAFLFFERLCRIVSYATGKGALVSVNTNGFWGNREARAQGYVATLKRIGLSKLVVSTDGFHSPYVREQAVINVISACIDHSLEVDLQYVYATDSSRLHEFAERCGTIW